MYTPFHRKGRRPYEQCISRLGANQPVENDRHEEPIHHGENDRGCKVGRQRDSTHWRRNLESGVQRHDDIYPVAKRT